MRSGIPLLGLRLGWHNPLPGVLKTAASQERGARPARLIPEGGRVTTQRTLAAVFLMICVLAAPSYANSPDTTGITADASIPIYRPELTIHRAGGPIKVDGMLDDSGWRGAAKAGNFAEHNPGDQTKPEVDTEVLITYDDDNLYVVWFCYDEPGEVRASFCERDHIFSDDYVILLIDTFGESSLAYEISLNPYGIPGDLLYSSA